MFSLEKLKIYDLARAASLVQLSAAWDKRHAVVDHLFRASESVVLNIAEGARLQGTLNRQHTIDYAIGSALECAACLACASLDLCGRTGELNYDQRQDGMALLDRIALLVRGLSEFTRDEVTTNTDVDKV